MFALPWHWHRAPCVRVMRTISGGYNSVAEKLGQVVSGLRPSTADFSLGLRSNRTMSYSRSRELGTNNNRPNDSAGKGLHRWSTPKLARKTYFTRAPKEDIHNNKGLPPDAVQSEKAAKPYAEGLAGVQGSVAPTGASGASVAAADLAASVLDGERLPSKEDANGRGDEERLVVVRNGRSHAWSSVCVVS